MNEKLTKKLWHDFPLLYKDKNKSIQNSLIPFGFECQDGWFQIIYDLSQKLEKLIATFIKDHPDLPCSMCGCEKKQHYGSKSTNPGKCLAIHKNATKRVYCHYRSYPKFVPSQLMRIYYKIKQNIVDVINWTLKLFYNELNTCFCDKYEPNHPRAIQVKEKFGTLKFYMMTSTDEMEDIINEAEKLTAVTCEACGDPGYSNDDGWVFTLCKKHHKDMDDGKKIWEMK